MNENNQLHGTLVLVRPDMEHDPVNQQGEVGVLTYVAEDQGVFVSFRNSVEGKYDAGNLMQLKDRDQIFAERKNYGDLEIEDYKDLYKISLLLDMGRSQDILRALEIAGKNPAVWQKTLLPVAERMVAKQELALGR
jgi:hypothetical protein